MFLSLFMRCAWCGCGGFTRAGGVISAEVLAEAHAPAAAAAAAADAAAIAQHSSAAPYARGARNRRELCARAEPRDIHMTTAAASSKHNERVS